MGGKEPACAALGSKPRVRVVPMKPALNKLELAFLEIKRAYFRGAITQEELDNLISNLRVINYHVK